MKITKEYRFESAHVLPWHDGKCAREHGHSYVLQVTVEGEVKANDGSRDAGMVMDFADIGRVVKPLIEERFDHFRLNDSLGLENPTAENMVLWLVDYLDERLPGLAAIRLYETATGWVEWER